MILKIRIIYFFCSQAVLKLSSGSHDKPIEIEFNLENWIHKNNVFQLRAEKLTDKMDFPSV